MDQAQAFSKSRHNNNNSYNESDTFTTSHTDVIVNNGYVPVIHDNNGDFLSDQVHYSTSDSDQVNNGIIEDLLANNNCRDGSNDYEYQFNLDSNENNKKNNAGLF